MIMFHIKLKVNETCSNIVAHNLPADQPTPIPRALVWSQKVKFQLFQNMVMLHIKLNGIANVATCKHIILSLHTSSTPGMGLKVKTQIFFFLKVVMLLIKLKEMENRAPRKHIFCPETHLQPVGWIKRKKIF